MKKLYSNFRAVKVKLLVAGMAAGMLISVESAAASDPEIIGHVMNEGSLQRYLPELKSGVVISYNGQKFYLENGEANMVELGAATFAAGTPELEILKIKNRKNGEKAKLKIRLDDNIIKTTARVCPVEPGCKPCSNWQIKFLSKRKQGNRLPDNFLFIS